MTTIDSPSRRVPLSQRTQLADTIARAESLKRSNDDMRSRLAKLRATLEAERNIMKNTHRDKVQTLSSIREQAEQEKQQALLTQRESMLEEKARAIKKLRESMTAKFERQREEYMIQRDREEAERRQALLHEQNELQRAEMACLREELTMEIRSQLEVEMASLQQQLYEKEQLSAKLESRCDVLEEANREKSVQIRVLDEEHRAELERIQRDNAMSMKRDDADRRTRDKESKAVQKELSSLRQQNALLQADKEKLLSDLSLFKKGASLDRASPRKLPAAMGTFDPAAHGADTSFSSPRKSSSKKIQLENQRLKQEVADMRRKVTALEEQLASRKVESASVSSSEEVAAVNKKYQSAMATLRRERSQHRQVQDTLNETKTKLRAVEEELERARSAAHQAEKDARLAASSAKAKQKGDTTSKDIQRKFEQQTMQIISLQNTLNQKEETIVSLKKDVRRLTSQVESKEASLKKAEQTASAGEVSELQKSLRQLNIEHMRLQQQYELLLRANPANATALENQQRLIDTLQQQLTASTGGGDRTVHMVNTISTLEQKVETYERRVSEMTTQITQLKSELQTRDDQIERAESEARSQRHEAASLQNRVEELQTQVSTLKKKAASVKTARSEVTKEAPTASAKDAVLEAKQRQQQRRLSQEAQAEVDRRSKAGSQAKEEAERKAKAKEEAERKAKEEAERKAKAKEEAERKAKAKEEAERKAKAKEEAERKAKAKEEAERKAKAKEEAERKAKAEAERKAKEEAERKAKAEAERKAKEEAELKAKEEAERKAKAKEEAERKAKEEAELKAKEEAELKAKEEAELKAKHEAERKAKEEAELKAKEEAERKAKEEAELKAKEEAERKAKEEAELKAKEEAERKAKEEAELKAKEEAELKAKEEAERKAKEEAELKAKEEAELKAKEEAELKAKEEAELKAKEEAERKAKEAEDAARRVAQEERERRAAAAAARAQAEQEKEAASAAAVVEEQASETVATAEERAYLVLFDYDPAEQSPNEDVSSELAIHAGELVTVVGDMDEDGFFFARNQQGEEGLVPSNFVEPAEANAVKETELLNEKIADQAEISRRCVALYDYDPAEHSPNDDYEVELTIRQGDILTVFGTPDEDGFYMGENAAGRRGLVPSNFVEFQTEAEAETERQSLVMQERHDVRRRFKALYDYNPSEQSPNEDADVELSLRTGETITVIGEPDEDGFYMAENEAGDQGLVPSNFVAPEDDVVDPPSDVRLERATEDEFTLTWALPADISNISRYDVYVDNEVVDEILDVSRTSATVPFSVLPNSEYVIFILSVSVRGMTSSASNEVVLSLDEPQIQEEIVLDDKNARFYVAVYDYDPEEMSPNDDFSEELGFVAGQVLKAFGDVGNDGFLFAELQGRRGLIPSNFVELADLRYGHRRNELQQLCLSGQRLEELASEEDSAVEAALESSRFVRALYDYDAEEMSPNDNADEELSFKTGQVIKAFGEPDEDGFFLAELQGRRGMIPSNFVEVLDHDESNTAREELESMVAAGDYWHEVKTLDESIRQAEEAHQSDEQFDGDEQLDMELAVSPGDLVEAKHDYDPVTMSPNEPEGELAFSAGDMLVVVEAVDEDGFLTCRNDATGEEGLVPNTFVAPVSVASQQASGRKITIRSEKVTRVQETTTRHVRQEHAEASTSSSSLSRS